MMVHTQRNGFRQIKQEERVEIYTLLREGLSCRQIAKKLERSHTTISREITRNSVDQAWKDPIYKPVEAEKKKHDRKRKANRTHIKLRKNTKLSMKILYLFSHTDW